MMFCNDAGEELVLPGGVISCLGCLWVFPSTPPFGVSTRQTPAAFLALVKRQDVRPDTPCDLFDLMLRDAAVVDDFLASTQENLLR